MTKSYLILGLKNGLYRVEKSQDKYLSNFAFTLELLPLVVMTVLFAIFICTTITLLHVQKQA